MTFDPIRQFARVEPADITDALNQLIVEINERLRSSGSCPGANVLDFGAKGDAKPHLFDGAIGVGDHGLVSSAYRFTPADIGKIVVIDGAGPSGGTLVTKLIDFSGSLGIIANAASTAVSGASWVMGSDDTAAILAARDWVLNNGGGNVVFPSGIFSISEQIDVPNNAIPVYFVGVQKNVSILLQTNLTANGLVWNNGFSYVLGGGLSRLTIESGLGYATTENTWTKTGSTGEGVQVHQVVGNGSFREFDVNNFASLWHDEGSWELVVDTFRFLFASDHGLASNITDAYAVSAGNTYSNGVITNGGFTGDNSSSVGMKIGGSGGLVMNNIDETGFKQGGILRPVDASHNIQNLFFTDVLCDTNVLEGWILDTTNGFINGFYSDMLWGCFNGAAGITFLGPSANYSKIGFTDARFLQNVGAGVVGTSGKDIEFKGGAIVDNSRTATGVNPGVSLANGTGPWSFIGVRIGNDFGLDQANGIDAGTNVIATLMGNNFTGTASGKKEYAFGSGSEFSAVANIMADGTVQGAPQPLYMASITLLTAGSTAYFGPAGIQGSPNQAAFYTPVAISISELNFSSANAPGGTETFKFDIIDNGALVGMGGVITGSSFGTGAVAQSLTIPAGHLVAVRVQSSAGAVSSTFSGYIKTGS